MQTSPQRNGRHVPFAQASGALQNPAYRLADILDHEGFGVDVPDPSPCLRPSVVPRHSGAHRRCELGCAIAHLRISRRDLWIPGSRSRAPRNDVRQLRRDLLQQRHQRFRCGDIRRMTCVDLKVAPAFLVPGSFGELPKGRIQRAVSLGLSLMDLR